MMHKIKDTSVITAFPVVNWQRNRLKWGWVFILFLAIAFPSQAQVYPEVYLEKALESNPALLAKHKEYEAALSRVQLSGSLPDPQLTAGIYTPPMERLMGDHYIDLGLMQQFPWFGTLGKQQAAAEQAAIAEYSEFLEERNRLFLELTDIWLEIYRKNRQMELLGEFIEVLEDREDIIYARYGGGQDQPGLMLDLYRLEIQMAELSNRMDKLEEEHLALRRIFNNLTGREEMADIETPAALPENTAPLPEPGNDREAFANNPRLLRAESAAEAARIRGELRSLETRPRFGVGLQYALFGAGDPAMGQMDGGHMLMPMVSVSLPIYGRKNQATREEGRLLAEQATFSRQEQADVLHREWFRLQEIISNLQRDQEFFNQQLNITYKTQELVLTGYASGDEGFDELLRIQDQLIELEWRLLEVLVDRHSKRAEVDKLRAEHIFK